MSAPRLLAPTTISGGIPTAGAGTANTIALWTPDNFTLGNSLLTQAGNVTTNSGTFRTADGSNAEPGYTFSNSSGSGMYRGTSGTVLRFASSGTFAFGVSSAQNVLIGGSAATVPSARLQVVGIANNNAAYLIGSTTVGQSFGAFIEAGTNASDRSFAVYNSGATSPYLFVRGDGNVGIGTASPGAQLHIERAGGATANAEYIRLRNTTNATGSNVSLAFYTSNNAVSTGFISHTTATGPSYDTTFSNWNGSTAAEVMRIVGSTGFVGIGTASPTATATVYKANNGLGAWNALDLSVDGLSLNDAVYQRWYAASVSATVGRFGISFAAGVASFVWNSVYNSVPQTAELMRLTGGGNLGIGTASPQARTHITAANTAFRGQLSIEATSAVSQITLYTGPTTTTDLAGQLYADVGAVGDVHLSAYKNTASIYFETGTSNTQRWRVTPAGHFLAGADNSYDIGASGATRPRTVYVGTSIGIGANPTANRALTTVADLDVFGVRVGRGGDGSQTSNTALGRSALGSITTGDSCTAVGSLALQSVTGSRNTAVGYAALGAIGASTDNTALGASAIGNNTGSRNTAVGRNALNGSAGASTGSDNVCIGERAGDSITTGASNIVIGSNADLAAATDSNKLVIGDATNYVATNGGATTYYATAGALAGYIIVRLNGTDVKLPVYAL